VGWLAGLPLVVTVALVIWEVRSRGVPVVVLCGVALAVVVVMVAAAVSELRSEVPAVEAQACSPELCGVCQQLDPAVVVELVLRWQRRRQEREV
jgi:hypothetical protein